MKSVFKSCVILGALLAASVFAEKVNFSDLPQAAQNTVNRQKGSDQIKSIQRQAENGKVVYEVEFAEPGLNPKLFVTEDGGIVRENRPSLTPIPPSVYPTATTAYRSMALSDLPQAVQKTVDSKKAGRPIAEIGTEHWKGKTVYQIEFQQPGRNEQIHVSENGALLQDEGFTAALASALKGTQFSETPAAVQQTVRREAAGNKIGDVDKKNKNGQVIFEVEVEQPGRNFELFVAEDGKILRDTRTAFGAPGLSQFGLGAQSVSLSEVPPAVQDRIKAQGDTSSIKSIHRRIKGANAVFDVEFQQEGINKRIEIDETGAILKSNLP